MSRFGLDIPSGEDIVDVWQRWPLWTKVLSMSAIGYLVAWTVVTP